MLGTLWHAIVSAIINANYYYKSLHAQQYSTLKPGRFLRDYNFYREAQGAMRAGANCLCPHCQIGYQSNQLPFLGS